MFLRQFTLMLSFSALLSIIIIINSLYGIMKVLGIKNPIRVVSTCIYRIAENFRGRKLSRSVCKMTIIRSKLLPSS